MNSMIQTDSYKLSHKGFMNEGTEVIYSNFTARSGKHFPMPHGEFDDKVVMFGLQHVIMDYLIKDMNDNFFNVEEEVAITYLQDLFDAYLGAGSVPCDHFRELHQLGYLPIEIKALPEGTLVPIKVPLYTVQNTDERFAWLTNYLETVLSCESWKSMTTATVIYNYRKLVNEWALKTTGTLSGTEFQVHDFSMRGMSNRQDSAKNGAAFLLSSSGTDNVPAIPFVTKYYQTDWRNEFIATSVPASEHSLASTGIAVDGELETIRRWITESYPTGIVSVIADTMNFWEVITDFASELKDDILNRKVNELGLAKTVFRPDSGNPADILCGNPNAVVGSPEYKGAVECLWDIFGGTVTEQGYKVLHERVGLIYGDSMTYPLIKEICERLAQKGFASSNTVFGIGSYTMQYITRDTLGMAIKATAAKVNGEWYELSKDPITDDGVKKSAKGLLRVDYDENGNLTLYDQQTPEQEKQGVLKTVFLNGEIVDPVTFTEIRDKLWGE